MLEKLLHAFCDFWGCDINIQKIITFVISATVLFLIIIKYLYKIIIANQNKEDLNRSTLNFYSPNDIERYTAKYISQYFQNINPAEYDFDSKHLSIAKEKIIPYFLEDILKKNNRHKYILILADTGMGKTAFLINLYLRYLNKRAWPFKNKLFHIKLIPLGIKEAFNEINKIENKRSCFLLLDAFDEDYEAIRDFQNRFNELKGIVKEFRVVIITARSQFFESGKEEPFHTGDYSMGEDGEYHFRKIYLSPFDEIDCKKYIRKIFQIWENKEKQRAFQLIKNIKIISLRPMLMTHIRDLIKVERDLKYNFEIYEELVKIWLNRESKKSGIIEKYKSEYNFKSLIYELSIKIAIHLYNVNGK